MAKKQLNIRLPVELTERVKRLASDRRLSIEAVVQDALERYFLSPDASSTVVEVSSGSSSRDELLELLAELDSRVERLFSQLQQQIDELRQNTPSEMPVQKEIKPSQVSQDPTPNIVSKPSIRLSSSSKPESRVDADSTSRGKWTDLNGAYDVAIAAGYQGSRDSFRSWGKRNPGLLAAQYKIKWHGEGNKNSRAKTYEMLENN